MIGNRKVIVVLPAYNAAKTLEKTLSEIPSNSIDEIILVDDASSDETVAISKKLGLSVFQHPTNQGYGGNQKTCYREALKQNPDIVVMIHPDYQYDGGLIEELVKPICEGGYDIMLGNRIHSREQALRGGMPTYKYLGNRVLTILENIVLGQNLPEWHTGFRAYGKEVLEKVNFERFSDDFIFDQQILISALSLDFKIGYINIPCRYNPDSSSINFRRSLKYGCETTFLLAKHALNKFLEHQRNFADWS